MAWATPSLGHNQPQAPSAIHLRRALCWQHPRDTCDGSPTPARAWRVEAGDVLLVRTGNYRKILEQGPVPGTAPATACQVACTPWFKERDIAMLGTDTSNDVRPSHYANIATPLHTVSLVGLGLWLIDNANLEQLAAACHQRQRYTFMLCMGPLRLRRVTGSPVNPISLF